MPEFARLLARHAPFLRELAARPHCCALLLAVDACEENMPDDLRMRAAVSALHLPMRDPYVEEVWTEILAEVRLGGSAGDAIEPIPAGLWCEVQFVFEERGPPFRPIVSREIELAHVELDLRWSKPELREPMVAVCSDALSELRHRIRRRLARAPYPRCEVPVLYRWTMAEGVDRYLDPSGALKFGGAFAVDLPKGRRTSRIAREVCDAVFDHLPPVRLPSHAGVPPDMTNGARWWAQTVFDRLPVSEIAERDAPRAGRDPEDHAETIARSLRMLGVPLA